MAKNVRDYLPKPEGDPDTVLVQAKIGEQLFNAVNRKRMAEPCKVTWKDLIEAGLRKYLDETK